jgi:hypothetical protein
MALRLKPPFPLYVDEITPDKIKATATNNTAVAVNLRTLNSYGNISMGDVVNGIYLFPAGRYICMLVKSTHARRVADGMVLLDLVERPDLAYEMGEKFAGTDLKGKFSVCYTFILDHPETHGWFRVVKGPILGLRESIFPLKPPPPYES